MRTGNGLATASHMRRTPLAVLMLLGVIVFAACGGTSSSAGAPPASGASASPAAGNASPSAAGEAVNLKFWTFADFTTGTAAELLSTFIDEFEASHPGITVELIGKPGPDIITGITATAGSAESPDVVTTQLSEGGTLVGAGALRDLSAEWQAAGDAYRGQFNPAFTSVLSQDGQVWGVPFTTYSTLLYRNLTVLEDAGIDPAAPITDWTAWKQQIDKVKQAGKQGLPSYFAGPWQFMNFYGGTSDATFTLSADGRSTSLDASKLAETLEFLKSIQPEGAPVDAIDQAATDLFLGNEMAFLVQGPWLDPTLKEASGLKYDFVPMPGAQSGKTGGVRGGEFLTVPAGTAHPAEAWQLVQYLSDTAQTARFAAGLGRLVANDAALATPEVQANVLVKTTATAFPSAVDETPLMQKLPANFQQPIGDAVAAVGSGSLDPAAAGQQIIEGLNQSLQ
jgi:multiple sugar transport system substrate-binding protein